MNSLSSNSVEILTEDGQTYTVSVDIAHMSRTLTDLMADARGAVPLAGVDGKTLEKVVEWCKQHVNDPKDTEAASAQGDVVPAPPKAVELTEEDKAFFLPLTQEAIFQLILAANYLDIKKLLDVCCRSVANSVLGKTPKQIYEQFGVLNELTPEEEEEIRKDNPWLEDN